MKAVAVVAASVLVATSACAQNAASLVVPIENEPAPKPFVEPPLPGPLAGGVALIPYRAGQPAHHAVGGPAARNVFPRVGHLHITLDELTWQWVDYGRIEAVDLEGRVLTTQTVTFTSSGK